MKREQDRYYLIKSDEGGTAVREYKTVEDLLKDITPNEEEEGCTAYGSDLVFLTKMPDMSKGYFDGAPENSIVIIKGRVVVPKVVQAVTRYEIE
jgi:hypothetical protein